FESKKAKPPRIAGRTNRHPLLRPSGRALVCLLSVVLLAMSTPSGNARSVPRYTISLATGLRGAPVGASLKKYATRLPGASRLKTKHFGSCTEFDHAVGSRAKRDRVADLLLITCDGITWRRNRYRCSCRELPAHH